MRYRGRRTPRTAVRGLPLLVALLAVVLVADSALGQSVQPRVEVLDNGLKILMVERHEQPSVALGLFYDVGSVDDPRGRSGIAHMFEHMMFKGSRVIGTSDFEAERALIERQDQLRDQMNAEMNRMRLMKRRGLIEDVLDPKQWTPDYARMKKEYDELLEAERAYMVDNELDKIYSANGGAMLNAGTAEDMTIYFVQLPFQFVHHCSREQVYVIIWGINRKQSNVGLGKR